MKKRYCPECGGEIMITRKIPSRSWVIGEKEFVKADNNISDDDYVEFHCENDLEHDLGQDSIQYDEWATGIMAEYERKVLPFL